jgi:hypothetical protein
MNTATETYNLKTLALKYKMTYKTFNKLISPIKDDLFEHPRRHNHILSPKQLEIIIDFIGEPK